MWKTSALSSADAKSDCTEVKTKISRGKRKRLKQRAKHNKSSSPVISIPVAEEQKLNSDPRPSESVLEEEEFKQTLPEPSESTF